MIALRFEQELMPKIEQRYLDCSIYLYPTRQSAEAGERFGGSGCLVAVYSNPLYDPESFKQGRYTKILTTFPAHLYAVTNRHVARMGFPVIRLNTVDGELDVVELDHNDWVPHPAGDDLAIAPVELPRNKHQYYPISLAQFIHQQTVHRSVGAGDDTFMVGRFVTHAGNQRNTPSLRFGSIAMLPFEKVKLDNGFEQEAFLVEVRSISGYSGSPVFIYRPVKEKPQPLVRDFPNPRSIADVMSRRRPKESITELVGVPQLLGIDCGHVTKYEAVVNGAGAPHQQWKVPTNTGMAIVIPAWRLAEFLNSGDLVKQRKEKDEQYQRQKDLKEGVTPDTEKPEEHLTAESYQDALRRASSRVSESESERKES